MKIMRVRFRAIGDAWPASVKGRFVSADVSHLVLKNTGDGDIHWSILPNSAGFEFSHLSVDDDRESFPNAVEAAGTITTHAKPPSISDMVGDFRKITIEK